MSKLEDYVINHSSCTLTSCEYGIEIDCDACQEKMLEEHDADIRRKTIEEVNKLEKTRWIPSSERLPEEIGEYIVTMKSETVSVMYWDGMWFYSIISHNHYKPFVDIYAWLPLPEPYKGE